jgi:glycosyltransferase involved in cell wall biosynthesis
MARILLIAPQPFFQWRGSPIRVAFTAQALAESGFSVDLLTLPIGEDRRLSNVNIIRTPNLLGLGKIAIGPSPAKATFDMILLWHGVWLCLKNNYALIHGIEEAGFIAWMLGGLFNKPIIFEKHSDPLSYKKGVIRNMVLYGYAAIERFTATRAQGIIGTGPGLVAQVEKLPLKGSAHHIFDIPSSLTQSTPQRSADVRKMLQQQKDETLVTFVGSFAVYQGIELMFGAISEVVSQSKGVRFVIIGGSAAEVAAKKAWCRNQGIDACVTFVGKIPPDRLPDYLCASDILLSPRLAGVNTPLKLLDYLKAGRPIVATDTQANRLILDDSVAVLTHPDPSAYADGIKQLVNDPALGRDLGRKGQQLIVEKYNFSNYKKRLNNCYNTILKTVKER